MSTVMSADRFGALLVEETIKRLQTHRVKSLAEKAQGVLNSLGLAMTNLTFKAGSASGGVTVSWTVESSEYRVPFNFMVGVRVAGTATAPLVLSPVERIAVEALEKAGMEIVSIGWNSKKEKNWEMTNVDIIIATDDDLAAWLTLEK